ncbi:MAG TPA: hypothetical protein VHA33_30930 [Candidatus Angelobacter sp.]|jgi:hypothetical protein|nr:hypothetical protein [Candidatus Angelobacter sp.]
MLQQQVTREIASEKDKPLLCPSAQPDMEGSRIIGVVAGAAPAGHIAYLSEHLAVTDELLVSAAPAKPTDIFRFAAPCEEIACRHFDGTNCHLATRLVQIHPAVTDTLPSCLIRLKCRWFEQEGKPACMRCPQAAIESYAPSEDFLHTTLSEILPSGGQENIARA